MSTEITGTEGELPAGKIVVVASRYNERICDTLVRGAVETLAARRSVEAFVHEQAGIERVVNKLRVRKPRS